MGHLALVRLSESLSHTINEVARLGVEGKADEPDGAVIGNIRLRDLALSAK